MGDICTDLLEDARRTYPRLRVVPRRRTWLRPVFWLLEKILRRDFDGFTTTVFSTIYVGEIWNGRPAEERYEVLRHELVHVKQFHCWPLGRWAWPVNHLLMALCYLLVLPFFWTMRAKFEREAYLESLLVQYEFDGPFNDERMERNARALADVFGGPAYAWMWSRRKAYAWAMATQRKINAGFIPAYSRRPGPPPIPIDS